ncbi:MAG: xaa-Pro aminopeptidase [Hyphomicrobiales bacterium]|nr:xaa-Pro aminopeptidase [Hyphomicrobiales bacterium]
MLNAHALALLEAEYPKFSDGEMQRRRAAVRDVMAQAGVDHLIYYGAGWRGSVVHWLSHWPVTTEAACVFSAGEKDVLFVHYYNHLALARRIAHEAEVKWGGPSTFQNVVEELRRRGAKPQRVGFMGQIGHDAHEILSAAFGKPVNLSKDYVRLRKVKSAEELDWFRIGSWFSDLGMQGLADNAKPGVTERELANAVERAYVGKGGATGLHFIGATPMSAPSVAAPCQYHSSRKLQKGDVVFSEISADLFGYSGQVLRTFCVDQEPTPLYRDLHDVAQAAYDAIVKTLKPGALPADVVAASGVIEKAGFTAVDDILHGYGGGYFPPVLGAASRSNGKLPEEPFVAGQLVVVQPNVTTLDGTAGVQTGDMLLITDEGAVPMHDFPPGLRVLPA